MIKIASIILLASIISLYPTTNTNTMVEVDRAELVEQLLKARQWERFTTEPAKYFETRITNETSATHIINYYDIYDLKNRPVYHDRILIKYKTKKTGAGIAVSIISAVAMLAKESLNIYFTIKDRKK